MGCQKIKDMVTRCRLGHPFEQWCIAYAAQASWRDVPTALHGLLTDTFSGWTQSRINEKANKVWRDACNRDNASGVVGSVGLWEKLSTQNVLGEFGRSEISSDAGKVVSSERHWDIEALFKDPKPQIQCGSTAAQSELNEVEEENKWLKKFDRILGEGGKSFTPESEQVLTAELRLLRTLHEREFWHRANDAWQTSLLPVGGVIRVRSMNVCLWVLKTNESAALCWQAEQMELHMWRKATDIKELTWYTCFDLEDVEVLQVEVLSPQSLFLQELKN